MTRLIKFSNTDLISQAKNIASENWGGAIVAGLVYMLASSVSGFIPGLALLLGGPLALGFTIWSLSVIRDNDFNVERIFDGFSNFCNSLVTFLLMVLLIFLWTLLFIIPGIIKALAYSQVFYIQADNPEIKGMDALRMSEEMMKGSKSKLFLLYLIFGLLSILCIFTLGIGYLFLIPVMQLTMARFYQELKGEEPEVDNIEQIGVE